MSLSCHNFLISYCVVCTVIIVILSSFLARGSNQQCETLNVEGDSQSNSATKNDVGFIVFDDGATNGEDGKPCVCPKWTSITILEMVVMGTLSVLGLWGIYRIIKGLQGVLAEKKAKEAANKLKKQEALEKKLMEKMRLEDIKRVEPAAANEVGEEIKFDKI